MMNILQCWCVTMNSQWIQVISPYMTQEKKPRKVRELSLRSAANRRERNRERMKLKRQDPLYKEWENARRGRTVKGKDLHRKEGNEISMVADAQVPIFSYCADSSTQEIDSGSGAEQSSAPSVNSTQVTKFEFVSCGVDVIEPKLETLQPLCSGNKEGIVNKQFEEDSSFSQQETKCFDELSTSGQFKVECGTDYDEFHGEFQDDQIVSEYKYFKDEINIEKTEIIEEIMEQKSRESNFEDI